MRRAAGTLVAALLATVVLGTAASGPASGQVPPTADPGAPTPTAPHEGLPPQGSAPDGSTVGGQRLAARGIVVAADTPALPGGLAASGWLVADADSGEVLAARDPHGRYYPASTLKLLTLLALAPLLDPAAVVEGTVEDEAIEGSKVGLVEGGRYRVQVLLQGLVLQSGNDAANALARAAGGVPAVLEAMNATAERLGAFDTVAGSPSGLDVAGQSSSPYDLALIMVAVLAEPALAEILTTPTAQMPPVPGRTRGYQIQNQNPLADYPGNLGGKTGFTDAARHTFVAAAERDGRRLVVSVMSTEPRPLRAAEQAARLLNWAFTLPADVEGVGVLVAPGEVPAEAPEPTATPTADPPPPRLPDAAAAGPAAGQDPDSGPGSPLMPVALTGAAALVVVATALGVQRALRPVRPPRRQGRRGAAPGPPEGSPSRRS